MVLSENFYGVVRQQLIKQKVQFSGRSGLSNVDLLPIGKDRAAISSGDMEYLEWDDNHFNPAKEGIDMYHHYKDDIKLFAELGFKFIECQFLGHVFFRMEMMRRQIKQGLISTVVFLRN